MKRPPRTSLLLVVLASALGLACRPAESAPRYTVLAGDLQALRRDFNAATGKVRAIFLASPT